MLQGLLKPLGLLGGILVITAIVCSGHAEAISVTVPATTQPWLPELNPGLSFGLSDGTDPVVIDASILPLSPGQNAIHVHYDSGLVSACVCNSDPAAPFYPFVDANGIVVQSGNGGYAGPINDARGDSGAGFPSQYMKPDWDVNLMELVGTFADDNGTIVGNPFKIGNDRTLIIPSGASRLQLGVNDEIFSNNSGQFDISVSAVPEPSTALTIIAGIATLGIAVRFRNST